MFGGGDCGPDNPFKPSAPTPTPTPTAPSSSSSQPWPSASSFRLTDMENEFRQKKIARVSHEYEHREIENRNPNNFHHNNSNKNSIDTFSARSIIEVGCEIDFEWALSSNRVHGHGHGVGSNSDLYTFQQSGDPSYFKDKSQMHFSPSSSSSSPSNLALSASAPSSVESNCNQSSMRGGFSKNNTIVFENMENTNTNIDILNPNKTTCNSWNQMNHQTVPSTSPARCSPTNISIAENGAYDCLREKVPYIDEDAYIDSQLLLLLSSICKLQEKLAN